MTDDDFLRAILASPKDDVPRMLYADWLEEQGDPYGEFIRTQLTAYYQRFDDWDSFWLLRNRGRDLLLNNGFGWCDGLLGPEWKTYGYDKGWSSVKVVYTRDGERTGRFQFTFRRGFIDEVQCDRATFLAHAGELFRRQPIRSVILSDAGVYGVTETEIQYVIEKPVGRITRKPVVVYRIPPATWLPGDTRMGASFKSEPLALEAVSQSYVELGRAMAQSLNDQLRGW